MAVVPGRPRVFCIGLNRTGTRSLHLALEHLGYRSLHWGGPGVRQQVERAAAEGRPLVDDFPDVDAFSDIVFLSTHHDVLDDQYPGSRFILTTRSLESWIDSRTRHVERNRSEAAAGRYSGTFLEIEPGRWTEEWHEHHARVERYFAGRDDLLVLRITEGDGWAELCPFLGHDVPDLPFPARTHQS